MKVSFPQNSASLALFFSVFIIDFRNQSESANLRRLAGIKYKAAAGIGSSRQPLKV
jgi:hypothetical protein